MEKDMIGNELDKYPTITEHAVQWGHMDSANHVNNAMYFRWTESARIHYFAQMDMDLSFKGDGVGPIMGWQDCKYIYPLTFPDTAICSARVIEIKQDRFIMECAVYSKKYQRIAALSKQSIIPYDYEKLCKVAMPTEWIEKIRELESEEVSEKI